MLEIFKIPPDLSESLIAFCRRQDCYNLQELNALKTDLSQSVGVYLLYYRGDLAMYQLIKQANLNSCCMPIYVGNNPVDVNSLSIKITEHCQRIKEKLDCN